MKSRAFQSALLLLLIVGSARASIAQQLEDRSDTAGHLAHAHELLSRGNAKAAAQEYTDVVSVNPENVEALANLGVILFFQGECDQAVAPLRRALLLQPTLGKIQALLGICQKQAGQIEEAKKNLSLAVASTTEERALNLAEKALFEIEYQEGDMQAASQMAESLLKSDSDDPDALYMVYRVHMDIADRARRALALLAPDSARFHEIMAQHFVNEGNASAAIIQYERALTTDPNLPGAKYELGEAVLQAAKDPASLDRAARLLQQALAENSQNAGAEAKLGQIAAIMGRFDAAEEHFARALTIDQNEPDALQGMADVLTRQGKNEKAAEYLERATQVNPLDDTLHYRLSRLYHDLNRKNEAEHEWDMFRKTRALKTSEETK